MINGKLNEDDDASDISLWSEDDSQYEESSENQSQASKDGVERKQDQEEPRKPRDIYEEAFG